LFTNFLCPNCLGYDEDNQISKLHILQNNFFSIAAKLSRVAQLKYVKRQTAFNKDHIAEQQDLHTQIR
jgi:hypothetical protein